MAIHTDDLLARLAAEIRRGDISPELTFRLRGNPPDPERFRSLVDEMLPYCSPATLVSLVEVAMNLVGHDRRFRVAAAQLIRDTGFPRDKTWMLCRFGERLTGDDQRWWHALFVAAVRDDHLYFHVLRSNLDFLLRHCWGPVRDYLLTPDRGPGGGNLRSFRLVIDKTGGCPALEQRWLEWVRAGRFDIGWPDGGAAAFGAELEDGATSGRSRYQPMLELALERGKQLLTSADPAHRHQAVLCALELAHDEVVFGGRVLREVLPSADPRLVPAIGELRSVYTAVEHAKWYGDAAARARARERAHRLREQLRRRAPR